MSLTLTRARMFSLALVCVAAVYVGYGLLGLVLGNPTDGSQRWREVHYILGGITPGDVTSELASRGYSRANLPPASESGWKHYDPAIGADVWMYSPWTYAFLVPMLWPPLAMAKVSMALWYTAALALIVWSAFRMFLPFGKPVAMVMAASTLAMSGNGNAFKIGQISLLVVAGLMLLMRWERTKPALAGLAFALALTKPTMSMPFGIPLLVRQRWVTIVVAGVLCAASAFVTSAFTGVNPLRWLSGMSAEASGDYVTKGVIAPVRLIAFMGLDRDVAMKVLAAGFCTIALVLTWMWRHAPVLIQFAIAAVAGWMWTYHQQYDSPMMAFLLLAAGMTACRFPSRLTWATFLLTGMSLWLPFRLPGAPVRIDSVFRVAVQLTQLVVWPLSLAIILWHTPRTAASEDSLDPAVAQTTV
jgi:Glycosyltransferase family 87